MPVNHMKEYLISVHTSAVLYFHTFMSELQMAPIIPISGINVPNLVQGLLRTCYLLIWPGQLEVRRSGLRYYIIKTFSVQQLLLSSEQLSRTILLIFNIFRSRNLLLRAGRLLIFGKNPSSTFIRARTKEKFSFFQKTIFKNYNF